MKAFKFLSKTAFVFSLVLLASCSSDNDIEETGNEAKSVAKKIEFKANIDLSDSNDSSEVTRATLENDYSVSWDEDDQIMVYCDNYDDKVVFGITPNSIKKSTATFTNYDEILPFWFAPDQYYYATYPQTTSALFDTETFMLKSVLSTNQTVSAGRTYDKKALSMIACADMDERVFNFKNVPALVKVALKNNGEGKVKFIEIVSKNSADILSGNYEASVGYNAKKIAFKALSGAEKKHTVRLQIPASDENKDFYIAVLPGKIHGFTLKFEGRENNKEFVLYSRVSSKLSELKSSKIYNFGSYDVEDMLAVK